MNNRDRGRVTKYQLCRDTLPGEDTFKVKTFDTYNDALKWLHDNVSYSWHHAFKHEGWSIREIEV